MPRNQRLFDIVGGGGLIFLLLVVFVIDQMLTSTTKESTGNDSKMELARNPDPIQSRFPGTAESDGKPDSTKDADSSERKSDLQTGETGDGSTIVDQKPPSNPVDKGNRIPGGEEPEVPPGSDPLPPEAPESKKPQTGSETNSLLGNGLIVEQIKALGSVERLEKLKVVRLTAKSSFPGHTNMNDVTLTWSWEPKLIIKYQEEFQEKVIRTLNAQYQARGQKTIAGFLEQTKTRLDFTGNRALEREYDRVFLSLVKAKKFHRALLFAPLLLEEEQVFWVIDNRLAVPFNSTTAKAMRNFSFALSLSNLLPVQRRNFRITAGEPAMVRGRMCDQFHVKETGRLELQFYFDQETRLLTKLSHKGHVPLGFQTTKTEVLWEHYFSNYRKVDDIQQWRHSEAYVDGKHFMTLDVTNVQFLDKIVPELRRPGTGNSDGPEGK